MSCDMMMFLEGGNCKWLSFIFKKFLLLFKYSCLHFPPTPPPTFVCILKNFK